MASHGSRDTLILVDFGNPQRRVIIYSDGSGLLQSTGSNLDLPRQVGRFVLRRIYECRKNDGEPSRILGAIFAKIDPEKACGRDDCPRAIPPIRLLRALDRDQPAKWCSLTCQRTMTQRRHRQKMR